MKKIPTKKVIQGYDNFLIIKQWHLDFCDGHACTASVLSYFLSWHKFQIVKVQENKERNRLSELNGEIGTQNTSFLQFHTLEKITKGVMGIGKESTVRKSIRTLVELGAISIIKKPQSRFDNTRYFKVHFKKINDFRVYRKEQMCIKDNTNK